MAKTRLATTIRIRPEYGEAGIARRGVDCSRDRGFGCPRPGWHITRLGDVGGCVVPDAYAAEEEKSEARKA